MQSVEMGTLPVAHVSLMTDVANGDAYGPGYPCYPWTL